MADGNDILLVLQKIAAGHHSEHVIAPLTRSFKRIDGESLDTRQLAARSEDKIMDDHANRPSYPERTP